jgi:hypothetical protein
VPSTLNLSGNGGDSKSEHVNFYVEIPIDASEKDAEIREWMSDVARSAASSTDEKERDRAPLFQKLSPQVFASVIRQHRVGRFQVDCSVLDEGKVIAVGHADLEVVFRGRAVDQPAFRNK